MNSKVYVKRVTDDDVVVTTVDGEDNAARVAIKPPTRTNWDALREDKQRVAGMFVALHADYGHDGDDFYAVLSETYHESTAAAIAANLAWLDAPITTNNN